MHCMVHVKFLNNIQNYPKTFEYLSYDYQKILCVSNWNKFQHTTCFIVYRRPPKSIAKATKD